jgi:hypothetical protein
MPARSGRFFQPVRGNRGSRAVCDRLLSGVTPLWGFRTFHSGPWASRRYGVIATRAIDLGLNLAPSWRRGGRDNDSPELAPRDDSKLAPRRKLVEKSVVKSMVGVTGFEPATPTPRMDGIG